MQKRNFLGILVGLVIGLYTVLGMSLFTFINIKFNSVYYAQHIPHKEGTEPDIIMLMENMGWAYTPEIEGISYDDDGSYAITREKGTKTSVLSFTNGTLFFSWTQVKVIFLIVIFLSNMLLTNVIILLNIINEKSKKKLEKLSNQWLMSNQNPSSIFSGCLI